MTAAMAMGQQQVLNKSAFLSIQMSLKHVCESVSEEHVERERCSFGFECSCILMCLNLSLKQLNQSHK